MKNFTYTDTQAVNSSVVDAVYYNRSSEDLAVVVRGEVYVFSGVVLGDYRHFVSASSVGRVFGSIKRGYGASNKWGRDVSFVPAHSTSTGTPKALTYAEDAVVDGRPVATPNEVRVDLGVEDDLDSVEFDYTVKFSVAGSDVVREYHTTAGSDWYQACESLYEVGEMLDLDFKVRSVTVNL